MASWDLRASALIRFSLSLRSWSALAVSVHESEYEIGLEGHHSKHNEIHSITHPPVLPVTVCSRNVSASETKLAQLKILCMAGNISTCHLTIRLAEA